MALSFEQSFGEKYTSVGVQFEGERGGFQLQNIKLLEALKKYDISSERYRSLLDEAKSLSTFRYMNMRYLAASIFIMDQFSEYEETEDSFFDFMSMQLNNEIYFSKFYQKIVDVKKESLPMYIPTLKKTIFSYCYKIFRYRYS